MPPNETPEHTTPIGAQAAPSSPPAALVPVAAPGRPVAAPGRPVGASATAPKASTPPKAESPATTPAKGKAAAPTGPGAKKKRTKADRPERQFDPIAIDRPGRPCVTCTSPKRAEIERMIVENVPFSKIVRVVGSPSRESIHRHAAVCVPALFVARRATENAIGTMSAEAIASHISRAVERADDVAACATDDPMESASGKASAIKSHIDAIKLAGMSLGSFEKKTKVEILLKDPEVQAIFDRLVKVVCAPCAKLCLGVLAGTLDDSDEEDEEDDDGEFDA